MTYDPFEFLSRHARITDPLTSHEAADSVNISLQAKLVLRAYSRGQPLLDHDAYRLAGFPPGRTSHQRCSDLRDAGFIERTGERGRTPSGKAGYLCKITAKGIDYLIALDRGETY
jgi:hypothetical protein